MSISFYKYVDWSTTVEGQSSTAVRDLVERCFTINPLLPPDSFISFTEIPEVGDYFGYSSEEYYRSKEYFTFYAKLGTNPDQLQFARWAKTAAAPLIYPVPDNGSVLANWTSIDDGSFNLTMAGYSSAITGLDFSDAVSLAAVAVIVQDAIQAITLGGACWTDATVTYSSVYGGFLLVGGASDVSTHPLIVGDASTGDSIIGLGLLGWSPAQTINNLTGIMIPGAILATGSAAQTITETLEASYQASNNFGSIVFTFDSDVSESEAVSASAWNAALDTQYMILFGVTSSTYIAWQAALTSYRGTGLTKLSLPTTQVGITEDSSVNITGLQDTSGLIIGQPISGTNIAAGAKIASIVSKTAITSSIASTGSGIVTITFTTLEFPEQFPAMLTATTNYFKANSVKNYMYQFFDEITPSVSTNSEYETLKSLSINFFGVTQKSGQLKSFYQEGRLMGGDSAVKDMGAYANEMWFKDYLTAVCFDVFENNEQVPASQTGKNMFLVAMQDPIEIAIANGTIEPGRTLTTAEKNAVTSATNDSEAWRTVENLGYWKDLVILEEGTPAVETAYPTVVYAFDKVIRKVVGNNILV